MKSLIYILIGAATLSLAPFLFGCDKADGGDATQNPDDDQKEIPDRIPEGGIETIRASHYILKYVEPKTFTATALSRETVVSVTYAYEWENHSYCGFREEAEPEKYPLQAEAYQTLCERYNDLTYDKERYFVIPYMEQFRFLKDNIVSIDIVSNAPYGNYQAGSSLKNLCLLQTISPRKHIASQYTETFDWTPYPDYEPWARFEKPAATGDFPVSKLLADCKPEDLVLIGDGDAFLFNLRFTSPPTGEYSHTFTVTITDERGKTFTAATDKIQW